MSAVCGKEHLKAAASSLSFTGSYWMSAEPFAACIACIQKLKALDAPTLFRRMGQKLTDGFRDAARAHGFDLVVSGEPALFYLRIANDDSLMLHQEWVRSVSAVASSWPVITTIFSTQPLRTRMWLWLWILQTMLFP